MGKGRLEAFSDGVLAIIITIMVLEIKVPHGDSLASLKPLIPVFISYLLSFVFVGIYWNNHHHMLHASRQVNGAVLWANAHLLFWLSLVPFSTGWMGENHFAMWPVALYGFVLMMAGIAYYLLAHALIKVHGKNSNFATAIGNDFKGKISVLICALGSSLSLVNPYIGLGSYVLIAVLWFIPDKRFENDLAKREKEEKN